MTRFTIPDDRGELRADATSIMPDPTIPIRLTAVETAIAEMPTAPALATATPPPVALVGAVGIGVKAAREDHTHLSSVQRQRMTATLTNGKFTWPFPAAYAPGVVPVIQVTAESPDQLGGFVLDARLVAGSVTNTSCQVQVNKIFTSQTLGATLLAIAGTVIQVISPATGTAVVHCWAGTPQ